MVPNVSYPVQQLVFGVSPHTSKTQQVDCYTIFLDKKVGSGCSSIVYKAKDNRTQEEVCIKVVDCQGMLPAQKAMILRESKFLRQLSHSNILKCFDVIDKGGSFYIVTEVCPQGDLYKLILKEGALTEYKAQLYMKGVANALLNLKKYGIIHRDLKPSNVLLKDGIPKLADFGFAIHESHAKD